MCKTRDLEEGVKNRTGTQVESLWGHGSLQAAGGKYDLESLASESANSTQNAPVVVEGDSQATASAGVGIITYSPEPQNCPHPGLMYQGFHFSVLITQSSDWQIPERKRTSWIFVSYPVESYLPWLTLEKWKCLSAWPKGSWCLVFPGRSWFFLRSFSWFNVHLSNGGRGSSSVFKSSGAKKLNAIQFLFFVKQDILHEFPFGLIDLDFPRSLCS